MFAGFPNLCKALESEKAKLQSEKEKICGSYPFDLSSPIHLAWERRDADVRELFQRR